MTPALRSRANRGKHLLVPGLVPGIHVFGDRREAWMIGVIGERKVRPFFERLCPALTEK